MLEFIRKRDVEGMYHAGIPQKMKWQADAVHLKTWQDLAVFKEIADADRKTIGEIGGGVSRILPLLKRSNTLFNIEKFEGEGNGPKSSHSIKGVKVIDAYIGDSAGLIADETFDIMFSVSVMEHVPNPALPAFFADHFRVMKRGGLAFHAIDFYVESGLAEDNNTVAQRRLDLYLSIVSENPQIAFIRPPADTRVRFASDFATNPDQAMFNWNSSVPALSEKRRDAQSVSLMLGFRKI